MGENVECKTLNVKVKRKYVETPQNLIHNAAQLLHLLFYIYYFTFLLHNKFKIAQKYLSYYLAASNSKGHGVHSPFVFDFIKNVLNDKKQYEHYDKIENVRQELLRDNTVIEVEDFGAGSAVIKKNARVVKAIAASSLKPKKYAQLLHRIVKYYNLSSIVELGTSFGVTTSYMAFANNTDRVYTLEGAAEIAAIAKNNFKKLSIDNIELLQGNFTETFPALISTLQKVDLAFIDGHHLKQPTLEYFDRLLKRSIPSTVFIFDDIHWSKEMEEAWAEIKENPDVTLTIDLFFIGLVFINPDFKVKQHFSIRF